MEFVRYLQPNRANLTNLPTVMTQPWIGQSVLNANERETRLMRWYRICEILPVALIVQSIFALIREGQI